MRKNCVKKSQVLCKSLFKFCVRKLDNLWIISLNQSCLCKNQFFSTYQPTTFSCYFPNNLSLLKGKFSTHFTPLITTINLNNIKERT